MVENQELRTRLGMDTLDPDEVPEVEAKVSIGRPGCSTTWLQVCVLDLQSNPFLFSFMRQGLNV